MLGLLQQRCGPAYMQVNALATRAPRFAVVLMLFVLASLALPLSSGFTAEFMILLGAFTQGMALAHSHAGISTLVAAMLAATGVVLGATYMLRFARAAVFGDAGAPTAKNPTMAVPDLGGRELLALVPLLALILLVGVWPAPLMSKVEPAVQQMVRATPAAGPAAARTAEFSKGSVHGN
jgi:NADH-quinone oxidoreductase subunit M